MDEVQHAFASYHVPFGGQFVTYPPGWLENLQARKDYIVLDVIISEHDSPIAHGIQSFRLTIEQFCMLIAPINQMLATTTRISDHL